MRKSHNRPMKMTVEFLSWSIPDASLWRSLSSFHRKTYQRYVRGSTKSSVVVSSMNRAEEYLAVTCYDLGMKSSLYTSVSV